MGLAAQPPLEGNFFTGIFEGLMGGLGLNRTREGKLPTSTKQGVARMWATAVQCSTALTGPRDVCIEPAEGVPRALHLDYEDDFHTHLVSEIPRVFSDPSSLHHLASSVLTPAIPVATPAPSLPKEQAPQDEPMVIILDEDEPRQVSSPRTVKEEEEIESVAEAGPSYQPTGEVQPQEPMPQSDRVLRRSSHRSAHEPRGDTPPAKRTAVDSDLDQSRGSSPFSLPDGVLHEQRFKVYEKDNENVHQVRAKIPGLSEDSRPLRDAIDSSPIFALQRAADETKAPDIIPYLEEMGLLADCPPRDLPSLEGRLPLYTRDGIRKHLGVRQVLKKEKSCPLIAVILPEEDLNEERAPIISKLHKVECLNRMSIYADTNTQKQIAFCPYCGVINENTSMAHSHARKHLGMAYFCGGCYAKVCKRPQVMHLHRQTCEPTMACQKEMGSQGQDPSCTA